VVEFALFPREDLLIRNETLCLLYLAQRLAAPFRGPLNRRGLGSVRELFGGPLIVSFHEGMPSFIEAGTGAKESLAAFGFGAKGFEGTLAYRAGGPDRAFTFLGHSGVWVIPWGILIDGGASLGRSDIISACI
jgi:hypothetical protein